MSAVTSGTGLSRSSELRRLASDESEPCVEVQSFEREGNLDGVDRDERLSISVILLSSIGSAGGLFLRGTLQQEKHLHQ